MALDSDIVTLAYLAKFELPEKTLLLCDGGQVIWGDDIYRCSDDDFGSIGAVQAPEESTGDEAPDATITFLPASTAAAATLSSPDFQGARVTFWLAEVDPSTGMVVGDPELQDEMLVDTTMLNLDRGSRTLDMSLIAAAERLFLANEGNTLSDSFHRSVWPGERGLANATGIPGNVAWGTVAPPRGSGGGGGGGGAPGGGGGVGGGQIIDTHRFDDVPVVINGVQL